MIIYFDEESGKYKLNLSQEEANTLSQHYWGTDFDTAYWLQQAEERCKEADRKSSGK